MIVVSCLSLAALGAQTLGCGNADEPYKATPAWSGKKAGVPAVPQLPTNPIKVGDAYTVFGARHHLQSRIHDKEVTTKEITLVGYIVQENISDAPGCAAHKAGKADDEKCKMANGDPLQIPSFWIADTKGPDAKVKIRVLGFAKNYASVFEALEKYKNLKEAPKELYKDEVWSVELPFPMPAVGAKVKITGKYGYTFSKSSTGIVSDPQNGVLTYSKIEYLEPPTAPLAFKNK